MPDSLKFRPSTRQAFPPPVLAILLAAALALCLACPHAGASEEDYVPLRSVTLTYRPVGPIPDTTVAVESEGEGRHLRIRHLKVSTKDWAVDVPQEALADLALPLLDTVRLITEAGRDKTPWLYVTFRLDNPKPGEPWDSPTVYLKIKDGRLVGRSLKRTSGDHTGHEDLPYEAKGAKGAKGVGDASPTTRPATQPSDQAAGRVKRLKAAVKNFALVLSYTGPQDKPYYHLNLHVAPMQIMRNDAFHLYVQITEGEAVKIIDYLATEGFLDRATDQSNGADHQAVLIGPVYLLTTLAESPTGRTEFYENLGWDTKMLGRLDGLRAVLDGEAAKQMDVLLGRLAGERKAWEKAGGGKKAEDPKEDFVTLDRIPSPEEVLEMRNGDGKTFVAAEGPLPESFRKALCHGQAPRRRRQVPADVGLQPQRMGHVQDQGGHVPVHPVPRRAGAVEDAFGQGRHVQ